MDKQQQQKQLIDIIGMENVIAIGFTTLNDVDSLKSKFATKLERKTPESIAVLMTTIMAAFVRIQIKANLPAEHIITSTLELFSRALNDQMGIDVKLIHPEEGETP